MRRQPHLFTATPAPSARAVSRCAAVQAKALQQRYQYDSETRLTQAATSAGGLFGNDTEAFTLDALGNRIAHSRVAGAWVYDANNRLTKLGNGTCGQGATCFTYDAQGNQTQRLDATGKTTQYRYDTQNRLVAVSTVINGISQLIAQYGYDPLDRRLWKEQYRSIAGNPLAQAKRSYYLYADEGLIAEASQDISLNADGSVTTTTTSNTTPVITTQYGPRPNSEFTTGLLFIKTKNTNGQDTVAYYHHDHLDTPIQATDKAGNIVWAASYNAFGQASVITPQATADRPTITSNLRLPGQVEDVETGLHYNYRRYYDPATGRYVTSDPIGLDGGINRFAYVNHDPLNGYDPMGEAAGGHRGGSGGGAASAFELPSLPQGAVDGIAGFGDGMLSVISLGLWNGSSTRGALGIGSVNSCSDNYGYGKIGGEVAAMLILGQARNPCNSFTEDTLVNVKPQDANSTDAILGKASLKPISQLQVGDQVLALAEWQSKGNTANADERLRYERVVDIFTSYKQQTLVYLTLDNGQTLTATEGHPFKTTDGWRDAILLKKGGKLLLKGGDADDERNIGVAEVRTEQKTVQVFNLEVANAHTFFVGVDGVLVHNARSNECMLGGGRDRARKWFDTLVDPKTVTTRSNGTVTGKTLTGKPVDLHTATSQKRTNVPTVGVYPPGQPPTKYRF